MSVHHTTKRPYEAPSLEPVGSIHELTLTLKTFGETDGDWFVPTGQGLATVS